MQYFFKVVEGVPNIPLMNEIWRVNVEGKVMLRNGEWCEPVRMVGARKFALNIMQLVDGTALGEVDVLRLGAGEKFECGKPPDHFVRYLMTLDANPGAIYMCGDETIDLRTGQVWGTNGEGMAINKSSDDLTLMLLEIRMD